MTMQSFTKYIFFSLNVVALLGWTNVLYALIRRDYSFSGMVELLDLVMMLEALCFVEVVRIAVGDIKGNLYLGATLHLIRFTNIIYVLPEASCCNGNKENNNMRHSDQENASWYISSSSVDKLALVILYSWAVTEICRYPMYLFSTNERSAIIEVARFVRVTTPLVTFPIGAFAEGFAAYLTLRGLESTNIAVNDLATTIKWTALLIVVLINFLLGPTLAYPALMKKGLPVLMKNLYRTTTNEKETRPIKKFV